MHNREAHDGKSFIGDFVKLNNIVRHSTRLRARTMNRLILYSIGLLTQVNVLQFLNN